MDHVSVSDVVPLIPPEARKRVLPYVVTRIILGARCVNPWRGRKDIVTIEDENVVLQLSMQDFELARTVAEQVVKELNPGRVVSANQVLCIHERAAQILDSKEDFRKDRRGIVMLKDAGGCGYWRMMLPARYMDMDGIYVDITSGAVKFEHLLEYDTIFVQRLHSWDSFYVLERLRKAGKRIVYDIDDDLFSIPADNPASKAIGRNEQMAAVECMKLADVVTTTTTTLQGRLESLIGRTPMVVPNSLDPDGGWLPTPMTGSPDSWKRIFWQGSNTHAEDWNECFDAVNHVMQKREDVRVVILGYLPPVIQAVANEPHWKGRIEYLEPMEPESYFQIIKHVRAEVGLAPLQSNWFNLAKSPIKWLENALIGMPTVASLVGSYTEMEGDREIVLCSTTVEWIEAIERCLNDGAWRKKIVETARRKARREYDIHNTARTWKQLLVG